LVEEESVIQDLQVSFFLCTNFATRGKVEFFLQIREISLVEKPRVWSTQYYVLTPKFTILMVDIDI